MLGVLTNREEENEAYFGMLDTCPLLVIIIVKLHRVLNPYKQLRHTERCRVCKEKEREHSKRHVTQQNSYGFKGKLSCERDFTDYLCDLVGRI